MLPALRMASHGIAMPKGGLNEPFIKQQSDRVETLHQLGFGFGGEAVHEVGVHHDVIVSEMAESLFQRINTYPFVDAFQYAVGCHLDSSAHGNTARLMHQIAYFV